MSEVDVVRRMIDVVVAAQAYANFMTIFDQPPDYADRLAGLQGALVLAVAKFQQPTDPMLKQALDDATTALQRILDAGPRATTDDMRSVAERALERIATDYVGG